MLEHLLIIVLNSLFKRSCSFLSSSADGVLINFPDREYTVSEEDESVTVCAHLSRGQIAAGKHIDIKITTNTDTFIGVHTTPAYCKPQ